VFQRLGMTKTIMAEGLGTSTYCAECDRTFKSVAGLRLHNTIKHKSEKTDGSRIPPALASPKPQTRKYTKREQPVSVPTVNFCPVCSCPIAAVSNALHLARQLNMGAAR
jgi:hypothetical protein